MTSVKTHELGSRAKFSSKGENKLSIGIKKMWWNVAQNKGDMKYVDKSLPQIYSYVMCINKECCSLHNHRMIILFFIYAIVPTHMKWQHAFDWRYHRSSTSW